MSNIESFVTGFSNSLNAYLGTQFQAQNQLKNQKDLMRYEQDLKSEGVPKLSVGQITNQRPDWAPAFQGVDPNQQVPLDKLSDISHLTPPKSGTVGGGGEEDFTPMTKFAAQLKLLKTPQEDIDAFVKDYTDHDGKVAPINNRNVNTIITSLSRQQVTPGSVLGQLTYEDMPVEQKAKLAKTIAQKVNSANGKTKISTDSELAIRAKQALTSYADFRKKGYTDGDARVMIAEGMGAKFDKSSAKNLMNALDLIIKSNSK